MTLPTLPALPASWTSGETQRVQAKLTAFTEQTIADVGKRVAQFISFQKTVGTSETGPLRDHLAFAVEEEDTLKAAADGQVNADLYDDEAEDEDLLLSDPKDWREQDNYAILGLSKLRWRATPEDIKRQFHKKVLRHHPDKKAAGGDANDDQFFKCIQKAFEILMDPVKRRQFDSVDPELDDSVPSAKAKGNFFTIYAPVFEREARFSNVQPVPLLGDDKADREYVENFYNFWVNFDSWRSFEHLDKEDVDAADNRDHKRYVEKKNKAERIRLKKEEGARLRTLVEQAMKLDPRIVRFRQEERERRNAKKAGAKGAAAATAAAPAKAPPVKMDAATKKKMEAEAKKQAEADKKAKAAEKKKKEEARKAALKVQNKIKDLAKTHNYFVGSDERLSATQLEAQLNSLDKVIAKDRTMEGLTALLDRLSVAAKEGKGQAAFESELTSA
ncbi:Zuotin [Tieghemiomyces parasiticus]|uniref:Zuotin n=1 Tax=Tieghemiomyces parasiticus TaxID=78921 RepID=A0A9W8AIP4_9FUNG|nr:Zuotin [Tieghemiomyces parasiticus]